MNTRLEFEDVSFASKRSVDRNGRLFFWNEGVYRAISLAMCPVYQKLLHSGQAKRLFDLGLIETELAPIELDGYDLVLKHQKVPFVSYATEWCEAMMKEAALLTLDLILALADLGLELQDAHPWNILFDGCQPKFTDFSSIVPMQSAEAWLPSREFIGMFYNPLLLMSVGCANQARSLLVDPATRLGRRVSGRDVLRTLLKERKPKQFLSALGQMQPSRAAGRTATITKLRRRIANMPIPLGKTKWSDYCMEEVDFSTQDQWIVKRKIAQEAISRCQPKTLLDIGSNTGWFSKLAALQGCRVIAIDNDETCINKLFLNEEAHRLSILPLAIDFRNPTLAYGIELRCAPATERLRCEMVLGLAIVHHLVFWQKLRFDTIVESLAAFTEKWLLVEFIPHGDKYVREWYNDSFAWYTIDNFVKELQKHFRKIEKLPSSPEPRLMFLCER